PWNHGGWSGETGRKLGDIDWGSDTARYYRAHILAPWFAHWLHDKPLNQPEAITFQTGTNIWKSYDEWPPKQDIIEKKLYLRANGKLSFEAPSDSDAFDSYVSDPANPVPYRNRPITPTSCPRVDHVAGAGPAVRGATSGRVDMADRPAESR